MPIPFTQIPDALLVPGQLQEIDNSLAGSVGEIKKALIIAHKSDAGTATAGKPVRVFSEFKAALLFGAASPAAILAKCFLETNKTEECWVMPVDAAQGATAREWRFAADCAEARTGAVAVTINGSRIAAAPVAEGATSENVAAAVVAAINGELWVPVEAEALANGEFVVRATVPGAHANIYTAEVASEADGVTVTAGVAPEGTQSPDLKPLLKGLGSVRYNYVVSDFDDPAGIKAVAAELDDRYTAMRQIGGRAFVAVSGDVETALETAKKVNCPHVVLVPRLENPGLPGEWAARWCAAACRILADDPAANTYDLAVPGLTSEIEYDMAGRQTLLSAGIATYRVDSAGGVLVERLVTTYTKNTDGGKDTSYLDVQVTETVDAVRTYINAEARKRYRTWKLASTDENFGSGAKVMSAGVFRSFLCELYQEVFIKGKQWCQDFDGYKSSLIVEIKTGSKTRLEYRHEPNLIGQFYVGAGLTQFR